MPTPTKPGALLALSLLALAFALPAQDKPRPPFVFEAGEIELHDLVGRCATYLQRNILVGERELQTVQQATPRRQVQRGVQVPQPQAAPAQEAESAMVFELQQPVVTDRDGCEELLTGLLWTVGLAVVPLDEKKGVYEVISMSGPRMREVAARAVVRTPEQILARPALRLFVTCVVPLQHTNATVATNALRPFFANYAGGSSQTCLTIGNIGNSSVVLLTGPQDQVALAVQLLQAADLPAKETAAPELVQQVQVLGDRLSEALRRIGDLEKKLEKH